MGFLYLIYPENALTKVYNDNKEYYFGIKEDRWRANFNTLKKWTAVFSKDETTYNLRVNEFYQCHKNYLTMVGQRTAINSEETTHTTTTETKDQPSFSEKYNDKEGERMLKYLKKYDSNEGIDIETLKAACLVTDEKVQQEMTSGNIYEIKHGRVRILE